jgi:hypothetical protein
VRLSPLNVIVREIARRRIIIVTLTAVNSNSHPGGSHSGVGHN